jgi:conjugative transfer signal peptidase TraF
MQGQPMKRQTRIRLVGVAISVLVVWRSMVGLLQHKILVNVTESMPLGLYWHQPLTQPLHIGQLVYVSVPAHVQRLVYERGYIPQRAQLVKQVFGLPGDSWCVSMKEGFVINGKKVGELQTRDMRGELLPLWSPGCHQVALGHVLIGSSALRSFDSRYFGPVPQTTLLNEVEPLWISTP